MSLSRRPLTSSDADAELFVDRDDEIRRIERSVQLGVNVLVVGPPGAGKTSLLRRLQGRSREAGEEWIYVDCSPWGELAHVIAALAAALGRDTRNRPRFVDPEAYDQAADLGLIEVPAQRIVTERDVRRAISVRKGSRVLAVDGLAPDLAFDLFGRFRDTLWEHEHRWVVTAEEVYRGEFLRPPANVFFETAVDLEPFEPETVREMLLARAASVPGGDRARLKAVAVRLAQEDEATRYPGSVVALARRLLSTDRPVAELLAARRDAESRAKELGAAAGEVFAALRELGDVHAGDERLLHRVNLSRSRVVQVLKDLEDDGLVEARRQGRRVIYEVVDA